MSGSPESAEHTPLTDQQRRLKDLFRESFRASQGDLNLQKQIGSWLTARGYIDGLEDTFDQQAPLYLMDIVPPSAHIPVSGSTSSIVHSAWTMLSEGVNEARHSKPDIPQLTETILNKIIEKDIEYQGKKRLGRSGELFTADSQSDPHASLLRRYAILGASTGIEAFDALYRDLGTIVRRYGEGIGDSFEPFAAPQSQAEKSQNNLFRLKNIWEKTHTTQSSPRVAFFNTQ